MAVNFLISEHHYDREDQYNDAEGGVNQKFSHNVAFDKVKVNARQSLTLRIPAIHYHKGEISGFKSTVKLNLQANFPAIFTHILANGCH